MWKLQTTYTDLANSGMTSEARAGLDPDTEEYQQRYVWLSSTFKTLSPPGTLLSRLTILYQSYRITTTSRGVVHIWVATMVP